MLGQNINNHNNNENTIGSVAEFLSSEMPNDHDAHEDSKKQQDGDKHKHNAKENASNVPRYTNIEPVQEEEEPEEERNDGMMGTDCARQLGLLRDLLKIERHNNEIRCQNNYSMQKYIQQLQADYLRQQQDLVEALELSHKVKAQKEAQISVIEDTLKEKDKLVCQLRENLENLNEANLRQEFQKSLERQDSLAKVQQDQLRNQISSLEQQLVHERVNNSQLLQQFQAKLDDQMRLHEQETVELRARLQANQTELDRLLGEPQNLVVKALRQDKSTLSSQVDELTMALEEARTKYDSLRRRMEAALAEQEQIEQKNQDELNRIQEQYVDQRRTLNELKLELEDKDEIVQILQFNLQRSEKRVKNLIGALKNKEEAYNGLVSQLELRHEQESERSNGTLRSIEKRLIECEAEMNKKQNEIVRLQLEHENQLESLRNDRDERLNRLSLDRVRLERELQGTELKLAKEAEKISHQCKLIDGLNKDVKQFKEESRRLSLELTKSEAKLYAKQQELDKLTNTINQQPKPEDVRLVSLELDESKRHSRRLETQIEDLKGDNEKLCIKLRVAEANLSKMGSAISREHTKMMQEYEKKIAQIKEEQSVFDRSKMRYKKYGYKLKKYCEHLRRVHEHLCNPSVCGYIIGPLRAPSATGISPKSKVVSSSSDKMRYNDTSSLLAMSDDDENEINNSLDEQQCDTNPKSNHNTRWFNHNHSHDRLLIKRTGISPSSSTPIRRRKSITKSNQRVPLRSSTNLVTTSTGNLAESATPDDHDYYYINDGSFDENGMTLIDTQQSEAFI